jgi:hypothetical protein
MNASFRKIALAYCVLISVSTPNANASILSTTPKNFTHVSIPSITIKVPSDPGIVRSGRQGMIRDLGTFNKWEPYYRGEVETGIYVRNEETSESGFTVHARVSNGQAGSGVKYSVRFDIVDADDGAYSVTYTPLERGTYQQGLIGKFPVPSFGDKDLESYLRTGGLPYKFEIDSPYNTDSVFANFERLANARHYHEGATDPVTGKIFKKRYHIPYAASRVWFSLEVYPYRNGSKAVVYAIMPASETAPGEVNYSVIIADIRHVLEKIAQD